MVNIARIDEEAIQRWMSESLDADDVTSGRLPGFLVVPPSPPMEPILSEVERLRVRGTDAIQFDSIEEYLESHDHHGFTEAMAAAMLNDAEAAGDPVVTHWDLVGIRQHLASAQPLAFVFPWTMKSADALPRLPYPVFASRGLADHELVVVVGSEGRYVVNDKSGVDFPGTGDEIGADLIFPMHVWRVGRSRPRVQRFSIDNLLQADFIEESKVRNRRR